MTPYTIEQHGHVAVLTMNAGENRFNPESIRAFADALATVACINGHTFGAGAFLAFAHDVRFMRAERGWICFPEADLGLTLGPVFLALAKRVMPLPLLEEMQYTVRRLDAATALDQGIITRACPMESLREEALVYASNLTRPRKIIRKMKLETLGPTIRAIDKAIKVESFL